MDNCLLHNKPSHRNVYYINLLGGETEAQTEESEGLAEYGCELDCPSNLHPALLPRVPTAKLHAGCLNYSFICIWCLHLSRRELASWPLGWRERQEWDPRACIDSGYGEVPLKAGRHSRLREASVMMTAARVGDEGCRAVQNNLGTLETSSNLQPPHLQNRQDSLRPAHF